MKAMVNIIQSLINSLGKDKEFITLTLFIVVLIHKKHQLAVLYQVIITSIIILSIVTIVSFIGILIIRRQSQIQQNCEDYHQMKTDHIIISNSVFYLVLLQSENYKKVMSKLNSVIHVNISQLSKAWYQAYIYNNYI